MYCGFEVTRGGFIDTPFCICQKNCFAHANILIPKVTGTWQQIIKIQKIRDRICLQKQK